MTEQNDNADVLTLDVQAILEETGQRSQVVSEFKERGAQGEPPDAKAFLDQHPEFSAQRSIVLDLAYEEFCQRIDAGESIDTDEFCQRFPEFEKSLRRLIGVHEYLEENPFLVPPRDIDWPNPSQTFQGFCLLAKLGQGAFSRVFLAKEIALGGRLVVVKLSTDGTTEAEILGRLQHPNIVPVYSVQEDPQTRLTTVCMPYLGSVTLFDILDKLFVQGTQPKKSRAILEALQALSGERSVSADLRPSSAILERGSYVDGAVYLACQLAEALAYSHSKDVCHSDLKPSNVLISPNGKPMLLDFNLAFDPRTADRRLGGTLPYMAPEQLRAMDRLSGKVSMAVGKLSDIFSLGVILYEVLSGRLPYGSIPAGCSSDELKTRLLKRQELGPLSLQEANDEVDPLLAKLVESCLALDPKDRPQSAAALAAALRRSISPARRTRRWARQHRWLVRGVAVSCLVVCLGVAGFLATRNPYTVRQINRGLEYYRQGQYTEAEEYFTLGIETAEDRADALFWRARTRQKAGRILLGLEDYEEAAKLCSAPEIKACQAYCWALEGYFRDSIRYSNEAIDAGFATAEVYNNLGCSYLRAGDFKSAMFALNEAIKQDDCLQPALHNRALAELRWAVNKQRPLDGRAGTDIDNAIDTGPPSADLYLNAARIYSRLGKESGQHRGRIIRYLREALRLGVNPDIVRREFDSLLDDPTLHALLADFAPGGKRGKAIRLADPLPDDSFWPRAGSAQLK